MQLSGGSIAIDDLGDAVLELILAAVCATPGGYRHSPALPLVCRRWQAVYSQSTVLWQEVRLDWDACRAQAAGTACTWAARWLGRRLPICRRLLLSGCPDCEAAVAQPLALLFPAGLNAPRLEEVRFSEVAGPVGDAALGLLTNCPNLRSLAVSGPQCLTGPMAALVLRGEALAALGSLHSLRSLDLLIDKLVGSTRELGSALSRLTHLALRCRMESVAVAPEFLEGLSQLRRLELASLRLAQFTPRLAQALSSLTHLSCSDLLAARPRRRAGITLWQGLRHLASLKELVVENQGGGGMPGNALACSSLRGLTLLCAAAEDWPESLLHRYTGNDGCLGSLQSLHLVSLKLVNPIPPAIWPALAPSLTSLVWHDIRKPDGWDVALAHAAALAAQAEPEEGAELFQAVALPPELSRLQQLRELRVEYAQLDSVPPAVQALTRLTSLSLQGNRISTLPEGRYLTGLCHLSLANNEFSELPEGLAACSSLQELSLTGNAIVLTQRAVERLAAALPHIKRLHLNPLPPHPASVVALNGSEGSMWHEHGQALAQLVHLLGRRLALEQ